MSEILGGLGINKPQWRLLDATPETQENIRLLENLGKKMFAETSLVREGVVAENDVQTAKKFLAEAIHQINPKFAWASLFEHYIISTEMAKRVGHSAVEHGIAVNPAEIQFATMLHDAGRLATQDYLRNDLITDHLFRKWGISAGHGEVYPSLTKLLRATDDLKLNEQQLHFQKPMTTEQKAMAQTLYNSLSPAQRIVNYCDNLGKRGQNGLFDMQSFLDYLKSQEDRHPQSSGWPSVSFAIKRRQASAVLQAYAIEETTQWLQEKGVDLDAIHAELKDYGPRFVLLVRHGEVENTRGIVYNLDELMKDEDRIHISEKGREQMRSVARIVQERRFPVSKLFLSTPKRAEESMGEIATALGMDASTAEKIPELNDLRAPYPYKSGMTMKELKSRGGNVYDLPETEQPNKIVERTQLAFHNIAQRLNAGETAVAVVHGDPTAWLLNSLYRGPDRPLPAPKDLRTENYPPKGSCTAVILDGEGKYFTHYFLTDSAGKNTY